jgi:hypothetical protein
MKSVVPLANDPIYCKLCVLRGRTCSECVDGALFDDGEGNTIEDVRNAGR